MLLTNLKVLLAERNLTISKVNIDTKISRTTLTALANNAGVGIQFETLDTLCQYLNITPAQFFQFYNGNLDVSFNHDSDSSFLINIEFCKKEFSGLVLIEDYDIELLSHDFYLDTLEPVRPDTYITELHVTVSPFEEQSTNFFNISNSPIMIKQIIQDKIFDYCFNHIQESDEHLVKSDKTKFVIVWE